MPFFRAADKLIYYAHVPKCGGSAIAYYLEDRYGTLGFYDNTFHKKHNRGTAWTATSPQHIDAKTLEPLLPMSFFDAAFAVVRHPVPRTVSTYHFQREVENRIPMEMSFSDWLEGLERDGFNLYEYDNHVLPMHLLVPQGAEVFYLEYGLDALVNWLDVFTGVADGPRVVMPENARGALTGTKSEKVEPSEEDLARIARIYAKDFERFGYTLGDKMPAAPKPDLSEKFIAQRNRAFKSMQRPLNRFVQRVRRRLRRI